MLELGGGFQPSFEAAAAAARTRPAAPARRGVAVRLAQPVHDGADGPHDRRRPGEGRPGGAATFRTGLANLEADLGSLDADYQSTLSSCPDQTLVTVDDAFAGLHPRYPVVDKAVVHGPLTPTPSKATVRAEVAAIRATGAKEIYNESWIPESDILAATAQTGVKVGSLDTLEAAAPTPWPYAAGKKYVSLMETNLSTIAAALHCPNPSDT